MNFEQIPTTEISTTTIADDDPQDPTPLPPFFKKSLNLNKDKNNFFLGKLNTESYFRSILRLISNSLILIIFNFQIEELRETRTEENKIPLKNFIKISSMIFFFEHIFSLYDYYHFYKKNTRIHISNYSLSPKNNFLFLCFDFS